VNNQDPMPVEYSQVEDVNGAPDQLLATLVDIVNSLPGVELGVTLYVRGSIVSGLLISGRSYFGLLRAVLEESGDDDSKPFVDALAEILNEVANIYPRRPSEESADESPPDLARTTYIHLRAATVHVPGPNPGLEQGLWRGRLSEVSGWSIGNFGHKPHLSTELQERVSGG
jgi:hypothetical protein